MKLSFSSFILTSGILMLTGLMLTGCNSQASESTDTSQQMPVTSADDAEPGSIHNLPVPKGVQAARDALAETLDADPSSILILEAHETDWSDSCLGLGGPAESCLAVITPGYDVLMTHNGKEYTYRTNMDGTAVRAE